MQNYLFEKMPVSKAYMKLALPVVLSMMVSLVYNMVEFRTPILHVLGTDATTVQYASAYYTWIAIDAATIIFGLVPSNILRTKGLAAQAMFGSILGSIVNMILDPIFIFGLKQGAAGARTNAPRAATRSLPYKVPIRLWGCPDFYTTESQESSECRENPDAIRHI